MIREIQNCNNFFLSNMPIVTSNYIIGYEIRHKSRFLGIFRHISKANKTIVPTKINLSSYAINQPTQNLSFSL